MEAHAAAGLALSLTCRGQYSPAFCTVHCEWAEAPGLPLQLLDFDDGINDVLPAGSLIVIKPQPRDTTAT